eukprot:UN12476
MVTGPSLFKNDAPGEIINRYKKNQRKTRTPVHFSKYLISTMKNREQLRRSCFIRLKDKVSRLSYGVYKDDEEEQKYDGIHLKDRRNIPMNQNSSYYDLSKNIKLFRKHSGCEGAAHTHRTLIQQIKQNGFFNTQIDPNNNDELELESQWQHEYNVLSQSFYDKRNSTQYNLILKLLKTHKFSAKNNDLADLLQKWLNKYVQHHQLNDIND